MSPIGMTLLLLSTLAFFAWTASRRWRQLGIGVPDPEFDLKREGEVGKRIDLVLTYALGQKKMPYYSAAGIAHIFIFAGFNVLLLNSIMLWGRGFDEGFTFWGLLSTDHIVGQLYNFLKEIFAALVLVGCLVFFYIRLVKGGEDSGDPKAVKGKPRMTQGTEPAVILGIITTMMLAEFLYGGSSIVRTAQATGEAIHFAWYEPIGFVFAKLLESASPGGLTIAWHVGFWWHSAFVLIFLNILPYTKHFHILTSLPNVFATPLRPKGRLPNVTDIEGRMEREEALGIAKLQDLNQKQILDLYTCTECGRCSDNCPAYITDKKLSPKHLTLALRNHVYQTEKAMFGGAAAEGEKKEAASSEEAPKRVLHTNPLAPEGGYFESDTPVELIPNILDPEVVWGCTTCRACEEQCPVMISYVDKIVGMRRDQMMMKAEFPHELQGAFNGIETNGNPWNIHSSERAKWSDGLDIPLMSDKPEAEVLYWVGCSASYDDRSKKVARSVAKLLKKAGVDFAILGTEETCTGDPARRAGNEYLFQMMAAQNVETLNGYGCDKKTIITACPHCFNTLLNEYPDFGGKYDVVHHTDFLNGLVARGKLKPTKSVKAKVVYHDSCYLGRYNDVYDSPRNILSQINGVELVEVPYWNKNKGLCCGAGGTQYFMEEQNDNRVNIKRTLQLLDTGASTVASACPFCMTMLTDGIKSQEKEEQIQQLDVAELLAQAIDLDEPTAAE
ncbi:MAG: (Fe-S)-binding protein [Polyangiales bacterium]